MVSSQGDLLSVQNIFNFIIMFLEEARKKRLLKIIQFTLV
jgi:hypothetical protein